MSKHIDSLRSQLERSFYPPAATGIDAVLSLSVEDETLNFRVSHGSLQFDVDGDERPDATFMFHDHATAMALLSGQANAFEAFMDGRFRSDGYLMWAFALMAMFRSASLPETPTE